MTVDTLSPSARKALAQLLLNEQRGVRTHRTAMHQSTRESLIGRGLVEWVPPSRSGMGPRVPHHDYLRLTDEGIAAAHQVGVL